MDFVNEQHRTVVAALNKAVIESGEPMEGNLYYSHNQNLSINTNLNAEFVIKRQQLALIASYKSSVLEIGFNAGHSAALMLCANPALKYYGIDIAEHRYTPVCAQILADFFPDRFEFYPGDSTKVYPIEAERFVECDLVHVDGGHTLPLFRADMTNALELPYTAKDRHILVDDTEDAYWTAITPELNRMIAEGKVEIDTLGGKLLAHGKHLLVKPL
ncbi:MAG: class I SAM-dependent methyltransferase [Verrucomicrobiaceae bacterium]|nr:MAG: class I SAM-dependent methyltransferase [Verrucomicrobiaceae bacterium]